MPDLDIVTMRMCESNEYWGMEVVGSKGTVYTVLYERGATSYPTWSCNCAAFKYGNGKSCKHIKTAEEKFCGWHEQIGPETLKEDKKCPRCNGETVVIRVGI